MKDDQDIIKELKQASKGQALSSNIESLERENLSLKGKIDTLRADNNSYLYSALVKVQAELPIVSKNSIIYGKQKYANLAEVIRISRPILVKYGLAVTQIFEGNILVTNLCHASGQCISSRLNLPDANEDEKTNTLQQIGKNITYLRRYAYSSIVGIATEDTDGN